MKIPTYQAQVGPQIVREPVVGVEGEAISETGKALAEIAEQFDQAQRLTQYNEAMARATEGLLTLRDQYENDNDPYTLTDRALEDLGKLKKDITGAVADPRVAEKVGFAFDESGAKIMSYLRGVSHDGIILDGRAKLIEGLDIYKKAWLDATSQGERAWYKSQMETTILAGEVAGFFSAEEAAKIGLALTDSLNMSIVEVDILDDPEGTIARLRAGEYEVTPDQRLSLIARATSEMNRRSAAEKHAEAEKKELAKLLREQTYKDFVGKIARGEAITIDEIVGNPILTGKDQEHFIEALKKRAKEIEEGRIDPFKKSDPVAYGKVLEKVTLNPKFEAEDVLKFMGKGLSAKDTEHFIDKITARKKKGGDPVFKRSVAQFKLYAKNGLFGDAESEDPQEIKKVLDRYYKTLNEFGRRVDEGDLKGEQIEALFNEMMGKAKNELVGVWPFRKYKAGEKFDFAWEEEAALEEMKEAGGLRNEAIKFLKGKGFPTTPSNIAKVMEYLKTKKKAEPKSKLVEEALEQGD